MSGPRVLVLGADGQLGRALVRRFAPSHAVVAPGRAALDLVDVDAITRVVTEARPAVVINAAAHTAVDRAESESDMAFAVNGRAPGVIAEAARAVGALVVHYSTDYVFDGTRSGAYTEDDATNPLSVYGRSKLAGEAAVAAANLRHLVFRTSWVYAATGRNFLVTMLRLARERPALRVVDDQHGAPTWAARLADATAQVLATGIDAPGLYHMTASGTTTWCGFAREIIRLAGLATPVEPIATRDYPTAATRPANSALSCEKLRRTFGVALPDWRDDLAACMAERPPA